MQQESLLKESWGFCEEKKLTNFLMYHKPVTLVENINRLSQPKVAILQWHYFKNHGEYKKVQAVKLVKGMFHPNSVLVNTCTVQVSMVAVGRIDGKTGRFSQKEKKM